MTKAAIYLRISLDATGEGLAVERQLESCQTIVRQRGWTVHEIYTDNSISASKRTVNRPAYNRMVNDFKAGKFDALVCYDLDRLTRQPRQLEDWIDAAEGRGLHLVTANGEADLSNDNGRMFARIKASVARAEVERKSARQVLALRQRAERGKSPSGVRLTGYAQDGSLIESEANLVRELFGRFAAGESLKGLATWLESQGVQTRHGGRWNASTLRGLLTNPRYAGRSVYRGEVVAEGRWEPIVSGDLFDVVQAVLNDPRRVTNREGTDRKHLGSGLFLCGECGEPVRTNGLRYWCPGHVTRTMEPIDVLVSGVIRSRLALPDAVALVTDPSEGRSRELRDRAKVLRQRLDRISADYDADLIDGRRYAEATAKVRAELEAVDRERARLAAGDAVAGVLATGAPAQAFDAASLAIRRQVISALVRVRLLHVPQGRRGFDPETVGIEWLSEAT